MLLHRNRPQRLNSTLIVVYCLVIRMLHMVVCVVESQDTTQHTIKAVSVLLQWNRPQRLNPTLIVGNCLVERLLQRLAVMELKARGCLIPSLS